MREPLRVTHVVLSLDFGGLERVVLSLARAGRGLAQDVSLLCQLLSALLIPRFFTCPRFNQQSTPFGFVLFSICESRLRFR